MSVRRSVFFLVFVCVLLCAVLTREAAAAPGAYDDEVDTVPNVELGEEYEDYKKTGPGRTVRHEEESSTWRKVLLYLPNRFLDFLDIFRFDVGVGPAAGGVLRVTKYGQAGIRSLAPGSLRVGLRGRKVPVFLESSNEFGIGPAFVQSHDRTVGASEVGAGVDLFLVSAYLGVDFASFGDFLLGIGCIDLAEDDFK